MSTKADSGHLTSAATKAVVVDPATHSGEARTTDALTDAELVERITATAGRVSYHEATDDPHCYRREKQEREAAARELKELTDAALKRGVYVNLRNQLVGFDLVEKFEAIRPADAPKPDGKSFNDIVAAAAGVRLP